jgi:hypothetical protein
LERNSRSSSSFSRPHTSGQGEIDYQELTDRAAAVSRLLFRAQDLEMEVVDLERRIERILTGLLRARHGEF